MSPDISPDIEGMADAQRRLRQKLGRDVRFYGPAAILYDPAIPASEFDLEGIPLDPLAGASAVAPADVSIVNLTLIGQARGDVLFQPLAAMRRDQTEEQAIAFRSRLNKDVILDIDDAPQASGASHFQVGTQHEDGTWTPDDDELWRVVNAKTDGFGALQRYLVFGQGTL